jgi:hypothetical protein
MNEKEETFHEKRKILKNRLANCEYESLAIKILNETGGIIQKIIPGKTPVASWFNGVVLTLLILLVGYILSLILGEAYSTRVVLLSIWSALIGTLALFANQVMINMFQTTFAGSPLDALESREDLKDLESWLDANFKPKKPLVFSLIFGPLLGIYLTITFSVRNGEAFRYGPLVIAVLASIQAMIAIYYLYPFYLSLPARISRYRFNLFSVDPSSSEMTDHLSSLFTAVMYITVGLVVVVTIGFAYFNFLTIGTTLFLALFIWLPTLLLYIGSQSNLSKIITKTKRETLRDIQTKIKTYQDEQGIATGESLDYLDKLMDYHDRVKSTPNSALNVRATINFLTSLLLPLLTLLLTNLDLIRALLGF